MDVAAVPKKVTSSSDSYYKNQLETLSKENKLLKNKLDTLERENKDLKKSIYDLSVRYDGILHQLGKATSPFNIDSIYEGSEIDASSEQIQGTTTSRKTDERHFFHKYSLKGHTAAVYAVHFSPCGKYLATGSFDKTVRLWDTGNQREAAVLAGHTHSVSELAWSHDSGELVSGSIDRSARLWDVSRSTVVNKYLTSGFVQSVAFHPTDRNIFFVGNTAKHILVFDRRQFDTAASVAIFENDSMINSLYVYRDGHHLLSGDANGCLRVWDTRLNTLAPIIPGRCEDDDGIDEGCGECIDTPLATIVQGGCVDSRAGEGGKKPISHIHVSRGENDEGRYLGVNSYDNVVRVYDRCTMGPLSTMVLTNTHTGYKNKNWPIKSAFFVGKHFNSSTKSQSDPDSKDDEEEDAADIHGSLLLATGSADTSAYIFDSAKRGGALLQRLDGHSDKVYAVDFHPADPVLASCSADFTVRVWAPKKKIYSQ